MSHVRSPPIIRKDDANLGKQQAQQSTRARAGSQLVHERDYNSN